MSRLIFTFRIFIYFNLDSCQTFGDVMSWTTEKRDTVYMKNRFLMNVKSFSLPDFNE